MTGATKVVASLTDSTDAVEDGFSDALAFLPSRLLFLLFEATGSGFG